MCSTVQYVPPTLPPPPPIFVILDGDCRACIFLTKATAANACEQKKRKEKERNEKEWKGKEGHEKKKRSRYVVEEGRIGK